jgi:phage tail-like protein
MSSRFNPYRNSRFALEIDGIIQAGFSEVTIPDISPDPIEYRKGNEIPTVRKIPGLMQHGNILLKSGITRNSIDLHDWFKQVEDGNFKAARRNISIILFDDEGNEVTRWEFRDAWPVKYDSPDFNAKGNEVAIETLEIAHEGIVGSR